MYIYICKYIYIYIYIYKCQDTCIKNQEISLLKSYPSVSSKPSKYTYIYICIYI